MKIKTWLAALATLALAACSRVEPGNVGVKVYLLGGEKGVDTEILGVGRYWIGVNEELYLFPVFTQTYIWTKDPIDGDTTDESITFQDMQGMSINADVGISFQIDPAKAATLFQKFRKGIDEIRDNYLRNAVRDALVKAAGSRSIEDIYGQGKTALLAEAYKDVSARVIEYGIVIESLSWGGELRLPPTVLQAINAKIAATQQAMQRENEVQKAKAEAEIKIAEARGTAESQLTIAKAEAEAISIRGNALRNNPGVVELNAVEKWDGKLPQILGSGSVPFIQIPSAEKK